MSPKGEVQNQASEKGRTHRPYEGQEIEDMEHTIIAYSEIDKDYVYVDVSLNAEGKYEDASGNLYNPDTHKPTDQDFTAWADETAARSHGAGIPKDALGRQGAYRPTKFDIARQERETNE